MSVVAIRAALETALSGMSPAISTAWENVPFTTVAGTAYQSAYVMWTEPSNPEFSGGHQEKGIFQVSLKYPLLNGTLTAATRAELLRTTFYRGNTFTSGAYKVIVERTPEILAGFVEGDRWVVPVRIRFFVNIF